MENNSPADQGGQRTGAELADQIAAIIPRLHSLEDHLIQALESMDVPANTTHANIMRIYTVLKFVGLFLIVKMGGQDMDPRFRLASALITIAFDCVKCSLLTYILLGNMSWLIFLLYILMRFAFIAN